MAGLLSAAELASVQASVASALDQSLPLNRKAVATDGYGHSTETWTYQFNVQVNTYHPNATQLKSYAEIIGSQKALMVRFMPTTDIREGDRIVFHGVSYLVQFIQDTESYTIPFDALMTAVF